MVREGPPSDAAEPRASGSDDATLVAFPVGILELALVELAVRVARHLIGEVDRATAPIHLHEGAVYTHEGRSHIVQRLDWKNAIAEVSPERVDYYTDAQIKSEIHALDAFDEEAAQPGRRVHGEIGLITKATMFKKIKLGTHENLGAGRIQLPELEHQTTSYWWVSS